MARLYREIARGNFEFELDIELLLLLSVPDNFEVNKCTLDYIVYCK